MLVLLFCLAAGCARERSSEPSYDIATGGNAKRGKHLIDVAGCGTCHSVPGVRQARGRAAMPLDHFAERSFIAGRVPNVPNNLIRWVRNPQAIDPRTAMPDVGLTEQQARDVAAYLYTLD